MALPTGNDVQAVDPVLTNLLVGYMQADSRFIADRLFPAVPVDKDSGTYYIFTKKYWFLDEMEQRAYGAPYAEHGFGVESTTYSTLQWADSKPIADEERANSQVPMDLEEAAVRWLGQRAMIRKERALAADFFANNVWGTTDNNSTTDWDDFASGDPVADILVAARTIGNASGQEPNVLACGRIVHEALINHPDIIDRLKYTRAAGINDVLSALGSVLGLEVLVSSASYSATNEAAAFSASAIIDDDALVCYRTPNPGLFEASAGYTFAWGPGGGTGSIQPVHRDGRNDRDLVKFKMQWDQKAVATDVGYMFLDVV